MGRAAAVVSAILREVFAREALPPERQDPAASPRPRQPGFLRVLLSTDPLPPDLPPRAAPPGDGRGALGRLLGPDPLPLDPPSPHRRRGRWLAWLFAPERLEP
jgi:hypothetical protein